MKRREFMQTLAGVAAMGALPITGQGNGFPENSMGLFFDQSEIASLRNKWQLPLFKNYVDVVMKSDLKNDELFLLNELDVTNHIRHIDRADKILVRESFIYLMTGQPARLDLALLALKKILAYPQWDYFLEAGRDVIGLQRAPETTISVSLAYDWLSPWLNEETKKEIREQLGPKGCEPCFRTLFGLRHPDKVVGWGYSPAAKLEPRDFSRWPIILNKTNLKAIPLCGLALGAATLKGVNDHFEPWMEMVKYSYETLAQIYCLDGSYPEGTSYGDYTTFHMLMTQAVLQRKLGVDLYDRINYNGFVEFILGMQMPHGQPPDDCVNFGDSGGGMQSGLGFYVARKTRDGLAQHTALHHYREHNPFSIIWYDPTVVTESPQQQDHFKHFDLDWIVYRTGYQVDDLVVAMRSGPPANHEHADRNSLVCKAYGQVLLADIKHPTYDHYNPGWILRTSPGHNTVLVDGKGHQYHDGSEGTNASAARAFIVRKARRKNFVSWSSDATPAYELVDADIAQILRTVFVLPDIPLLVVVDSMKKKEKSSTFSCRWHVDNSDKNGRCLLHKNGFVIHRPTAKFYATYAGDQEFSLHNETMAIPVEYGVYPYVQVDTKNPSPQALLVMVGMPLRPQQPEPVISVDKDYRIRIDHADKHYTLQLLSAGRLPFLRWG
jgi:hypothetical protein